MRKFFHYLFGLILFVLLVGAAGFVVDAALHMPLWASAVGLMQQYPAISLGGVGVVLCVVVLYLLTGVQRRKPDQFISFDNEGGSVSISMNAMREFLIKIADEFAAVLYLDPTIKAYGEAMEIELDVRVRSGTALPELCRLLQSRVSESIRDELGLSEVKGVKVNIREIVTPPAEKKPKEKKEEPVAWEGSIRP